MRPYTYRFPIRKEEALARDDSPLQHGGDFLRRSGRRGAACREGDKEYRCSED